MDECAPIHEWFGLSYANYLVLPRTLLQSMPLEWQKRFVTYLEEMGSAFEYIEHAPRYVVKATSYDGKFISDPVPRYERGRTRIVPRIRGE